MHSVGKPSLPLTRRNCLDAGLRTRDSHPPIGEAACCSRPVTRSAEPFRRPVPVDCGLKLTASQRKKKVTPVAWTKSGERSTSPPCTGDDSAPRSVALPARESRPASCDADGIALLALESRSVSGSIGRGESGFSAGKVRRRCSVFPLKSGDLRLLVESWSPTLDQKSPGSSPGGAT
jgi:hypothetical protein